MATDPVCGMTVDESSALSAERDGEVWYFCCSRCRQTFLQRDLQQAPIVPAAGSDCCEITTSSALFYCPMCEGVFSDQPGTCPSCGMALESRAPGAANSNSGSELSTMVRRLAASLVFGVPVFLLSMLPMLGVPVDRWIDAECSLWTQLVLSSVVVAGCGFPFFQRGWRSLIAKQLNMFTLISIGVGAAWCYSVVAVTLPDIIPDAFRRNGQVDVYFEAAAMITMLVLLGQVLESRARQRTGSAIRELIALAPPTASVLRDGKEVRISLDAVQQGDTLRVRPGEKVPVDGQIIDGGSRIDESMITGESTSVIRSVGDSVIGGTINQSGSFLMRGDRVGNQTMLARIIDMVSKAQRSRAPIQRIADVAASYFVQGVLCVAAVTFLVWAIAQPAQPALAYALVNAVAVLIVACPCALGLATPMSVMVGIGRGAQMGVLVRDAEVLEQLEKIDTVLVDKTGTLTEGRPRLTVCLPCGLIDEDELLTLAAAVERNSEHPLGAAIVQAATDRGIPIPESLKFEAVPGRGVRATVDGRVVAVGSQEFAAVNGCCEKRLPDVLDKQTARLREEGQTVFFASVDGVLAGLLAIADPIRDSTRDSIDSLRSLGLRIVMLTGDNTQTAKAVADHVGIDEFEAALSPEDKLTRIGLLRANGHSVAMVGDGINDAPALAAANVGIAMGTGAGVAIEAAGITLVGADMRGLVRSIHLSRRVMQNIRQNLVFAFGYNMVGIPVAAGVLYPISAHLLLNPMLAAAAMSCSCVSVIGNALRLRFLRLT